MTLSEIRDWYWYIKGTAQGLGVEHVSVNIVAHDSVQQQCDDFIDDVGLRIIANDYNTEPAYGVLQTNACHDSFQAQFLKPVFVIINCVSNSVNTAQYQLLLNEWGTPLNWNAAVTQWRAAIESVQAPPPELTAFRLTTDGGFQFVLPGQPGRTNQVLGSFDLINWSVLASYYGTNGPIVFRDENIGYRQRRFYQVRRL